MPAPLALPVAAPLIFAGNCRITVVGDRSRYTFRVSAAKPNPNYNAAAPTFFVSLLTGPDNTSDYQYIGVATPGAGFRLTRASRLPANSPPVLAASFMFRALDPDNESGGLMWSRIAVWHEDTCARCGRALTDPASIATRIGPECRRKMGVDAPVLVDAPAVVVPVPVAAPVAEVAAPAPAAVVADADAVEAAEAAPAIPASRPTARARRAAPAAPATVPMFRESLPTGDDIAY